MEKVTNEKLLEYMQSGFEMVMGEIVDLKDRMDRNEQQIDKLNINSENTNKQLIKIENRLDGVECKLDRLETKVDKIDERLTNVESDVKTIKDVVKSHEKRISKLEMAQAA